MKKPIFFLAIFLIYVQCETTDDPGTYLFLDPDLPIDERVDNLISQLTMEEKVGQLNYDAPAVERLGIPEYNWWNECLHGVGRAGLATVFPQAIGMAASWNEDLLHTIGNVISDEARAKYYAFQRAEKRDIYYGLTFWTPNINIFRDPRWGRGQETYGEDPFLTGRLAVPFIRGLQGDHDKYLKVVATAKHFAVHSGPEHSRHSINIDVSNTDLYETYLPAFRDAVNKADVASIMCAYNRFRDEACCGSNLLLQSVLRDDWNFKGYVVSDCGAISDIYQDEGHDMVDTPAQAAAIAFRAGTDLNCGGTSKHLVEALEKGLIGEEEIDKALRRLFTARFKLGLFDLPQQVPFSSITYDEVRSEENLKTALQASRESIVLLKNDNILPLPADVGKVAVIGPLADDYRVLLGNYNGTSDNLFTPLRAIRDYMKDSGGEVYYSAGCQVTAGVPILEPVPSEYLTTTDQQDRGLNARYFDNRDFEGEPAITRVDDRVNFWWYDQTPVNGGMAEEFGVVWEGYIKAPASGEYSIGVNAGNAARFYFQDSLRLGFDNVHHPLQQSFVVSLEEGTLYPVRLEFFSYGNDPQAHLLWGRMDEDLTDEALQQVGRSDVVILCMGLSPYLEGEEMPVKVEGFSGGDRTDIKLPSTQLELMKKVVATGKPVVLVLMGGSSIAATFADQHIPGILHAWYPGEMGGKAIKEVLFGEVNPSGKLPLTFYRSVDDLPPFDDYGMSERTYKYFTGKVLYPFGHGLSYTHFQYSDLQVNPVESNTLEAVTVSVKVRNAGTRPGAEVVQLYLKDLISSVDVPHVSLEGFEKIVLAQGEEKVVSFRINPDQLSVINDNGEAIVEPGSFKLFVGGKQPGMTGTADNPTTQVLEGMFTYSGSATSLKD